MKKYLLKRQVGFYLKQSSFCEEKKVEILLHDLFQPIVCGFLVWSISFGGCFLSLALKTV